LLRQNHGGFSPCDATRSHPTQNRSRRYESLSPIRLARRRSATPPDLFSRAHFPEARSSYLRSFPGRYSPPSTRFRWGCLLSAGDVPPEYTDRNSAHSASTLRRVRRSVERYSSRGKSSTRTTVRNPLLSRGWPAVVRASRSFPRRYLSRLRLPHECSPTP